MESITPLVTVVDPNEVQKMLSQIFQAVAHGQWWVFASLVVNVLTWATRIGATRLLPEKISNWFNSPFVSFLLPFILASVGGFVTAIASGAPFSVGLLLAEIIKVGSGAVAMYIGKKKLNESAAIKAGVEAVAKPEETLNK